MTVEGRHGWIRELGRWYGGGLLMLKVCAGYGGGRRLCWLWRWRWCRNLCQWERERVSAWLPFVFLAEVAEEGGSTASNKQAGFADQFGHFES